MKKIFLVSMMLTMVMAAQAQLKVAPQMQKGDQKNYEVTIVTDIPGQGSFTINEEMAYSVTDATATGYVVKMETTKMTSDVKAENIAGQIVAAAQEVMINIPLLIATDKAGKPLGINNYAEISKKIDTQSDVLIEKMFKAIPQLSMALPKNALKQQILTSLSEEALLKTIQWSVNPMALNGKTIMTGAQEEYINDQGIKMKRMYFVNGRNVTVSGSANMSKEELKKLIIEQVEKMMPEQADMVKQNIDQLIESGMLKLDMKETGSYEYQEDGWVKTIKSENVTENMGQKVSVNTTVTLK
ncbi:MAG: hypothetical protein IJV09_04725 [Prevotella sp.]|nr:hypothetical protein [Prevotella sp.]